MLTLSALRRWALGRSPAHALGKSQALRLHLARISSRTTSDVELRAQFKDLMLELGIPIDIIERITQIEVTNRELLNVARLSCFGRLQYYQTAGLFVAALLQRALSIKAMEARQRIVDQLDQDGAVPFGPLVSVEQAREAAQMLTQLPCYNGHTPEASIDKIGRYVGGTADEYPFGSYTTLDVASAPHLLEAVMASQILALAESHLGCTPTLSALQAWWNFPGHERNAVAEEGGTNLTEYAPQNYHRDLNDFRMFWVYIYLTDVDEECGPHQVLKRTGDWGTIAERLAGRSELTPQDFFYQYGYQIPRATIDVTLSDLQVTFQGASGTSFLSNGFNLHRIRYPLRKPRLMFAARFCINPMVARSELESGASIPADQVARRIGDSERVRYITRHLVDWS